MSRPGARRCPARPAVAFPMALLALALVAAGCAGAKRHRGPPPLQLEIAAGPGANHGGPFHLVVRKCDAAGLLADYDAIAEGVFRVPPDPAVLRRAVVRPGEVLQLEVPRELGDGEVLGVYFLLTSPGDRWRFGVKDASVARVRVRLGPLGIEAVEPRR